MSTFKKLFGDRSELVLIAGVILILFVLFSPIPPVVLDLALIVNFGLSLTILLLTLQVAKPVEFSTFPSLLLISTLLRLALNIAATRLILSDADAGAVIGSIGAFAVGGNFVVGLVVFLILIVVQYVVVTSGAQRVSEVAARFTLDSMPGQQMSIDADLNMGLIDQKEAIARRKALEKEASFYGAMDGASKFVKGDAIAGVIILLIDIIAGWIIGVAQMGMSWDDALAHFSLLTIGDGIATQLPALIISTATGIIVTRSSADRRLSTEVFQQLSSAPRIPIIVAALLTALLLLPGMPKWPIVPVIAMGYFAWRRASRAAPASAEISSDEASAPVQSPAPITIALGDELSNAWKPMEALLLERVSALRGAHQKTFGAPFPPLSFIADNRLGSHDYEIRIFDTRYGMGQILPDRLLALQGDKVSSTIAGIATTDPAFGISAVWIEDADRERARQLGYSVIDPVTAFMTHLGETLRAEAPALMNRASVTELLEGVRSRLPGLVEELVPQLMSVGDIQRTLQLLIAEETPITPLENIIEHLADLARHERDPAALNELLRQRLANAICGRLRDRHPDLAVISLDPRLENRMTSAVLASSKRDGSALEPRLVDKLLRQLIQSSNEMIRQGRRPVLLSGGELRRPLRAITKRALPRLAVLSVAEVSANIELSSFAVVRIEEDDMRNDRARPAPSISTEQGGANAPLYQ